MEDINISKILDNSIQDEEDILKNRLIIPFNFDITKNIKIITSDVCGLGKSFKIKKMILKKIKHIIIFRWEAN